MRTIQKLRKESQLNSLIKKKRYQDFAVLFHSTWSKSSQKLLDLAEEKWCEQDGDLVLYTISSWDIPHGFVAFQVTKVPTLITCKKGRIRKHDYMPQLHNYLSGFTGSRTTGRV
jgi:thioredoxin-like negative regulator of GroEL